jgi:methylmalonyl-CoA mutase
MTESDDFPLAAAFPPATRAQWQRLVEGVLKGAPFDRLATSTADGLRIEPLAPRRADAEPVAGRAPGRAWQVPQRIEHPDPAAANAQALHELENGAGGLKLVFAGAIGAHGFGLPAGEDALARALDGVRLDAGLALELDLPATTDAAVHLAALVARSGWRAGATDIRFGFDPLGGMAATGVSRLPWRALATEFAGTIGELSAGGFQGPFAAADGRAVHNAGGSQAQELGFALAVGLAYLRALEASGLTLDAARRAIFFRLTADADQFLTIAKFRALRKLWARVETACGIAPAPAFISAETDWRSMTQRDPHVNMLRATIAVFSAAVGGADAISVLPFTAALGLPDRFARRIARNTQLILREEAHLARVADPAAGAGGIEDLTEKLCGAGWSLLQEIERAGGAAEALVAGLLQRKVAEVRAQREAAVARREHALIGSSEFPDLAEVPASVILPFPAQDRGGRPARARGIAFAPLAASRLAQPFERLRDASDRALAQTGARPKVFLANLGTPADFSARATFAQNFFAAGGIAAVASGDPADRSMIAFKASGAGLACLCGSDKIYATDAADAARALKAAGVRYLYLAGRPGEHETQWRAAGVDTFIYAGCDALATLQAAHAMLGL